MFRKNSTKTNEAFVANVRKNKNDYGLFYLEFWWLKKMRIHSSAHLHFIMYFC